MAFICEIVQSEDLFDMIKAERYAFENPLQPIFRLYCPIIDNDLEKTLADTAKSAQESLAEQTTSPTAQKTESTWLKVIRSTAANVSTEKETGQEILGGAEWIFHKENTPTSIPDKPAILESVQSLASRHPEGGARMFAEQAFTLLRTAEIENRVKYSGGKPYMSLGSCFTAPEYRRQGIGHLVMEWGVKKADEMGLDIWIEAAPSAVPFYQRYGFVSMKTVELHVEMKCPDELEELEREQWEETRDFLLPVTAVIMGRVIVRN